jgi:hypothetical protein
VAAVVALALTSGVPARAASLSRAFSAQVAAFPVEPAPGLNQTTLGVRPAATRASVSNPPAASYGRSAQYDLGTIELYTGPPPPETVAECATGSANIPEHAAASPQDMQLVATCTAAPGADVSAVARSYESAGLQVQDIASRVTADGGGTAVTTTARVDVQGISLGPLVISGVATTASASANGAAGGATAAGRVVASGGTVNGTPVVIGPDGIEIDRQKVPIEFVAPATAALHDALAQGGYSDVRVVQPAIETSADGMHASVKGGGLIVYFTNNDPAQNYFLRLTFGGVDAAVDLGQGFGGSGPAPAPGGSSAEPPLNGDGAVLGSSGSSSLGAGGAQGGEGSSLQPAPRLTASRRTYDLPAPWRGWPYLLSIGVVAAIAGWLTRRRLLTWWTVSADRYLRG